MARVHIPAQGISLTNKEEIGEFLAPFGIWYERWDDEQIRIAEDSDPDQILKAYATEIDLLKAKGGFVTADLVEIKPSTAGLEELLAKFSKEHTHSEDEVRYCINGRGIFHINPVTNIVFSIEMEAGDLINVPAGTRHWFNLCQDKTIKVIRLFQDTSGWTPHYLDDRVDQQYEPLCFSESLRLEARKHSLVQP